MKKLPRPGKPKSLRKPAVKHSRSPIKATPAAKKSSNVASTDYNPETGQLIVQFAGGSRYRYSGVSKETAGGIEGAASVGGYLHSHIIGKHSAVKL